MSISYTLYSAKAEPKATIMTPIKTGSRAECARTMDRLNKIPGDKTRCLIYASTGHFVSGTL